MTNDGKGAIATSIKPQDTKAIVQWKGEPITITAQDVKNFICPLATNQEIGIFLKMCQSLQLNPFANEIYLIKFSTEEKAASVIAIESYLKAAEVNKDYDGCEAGIVLRDGAGRLEFREGAFIQSDEKDRLVGGWARVYRKDRTHPDYVAVNKTECIKLKKSGEPTKFWTEPKQPWMLRKTALKRALVEAFPSLFVGTLANTEVAADAEYHLMEGELPVAFENSGVPDWPKFWVRVENELGLTEKQAHELLEMDSLKQSIEEGGWTLEDIWTELVKRVQARSEAWPQPVDEDFQEMFDDSVAEVPVDMVWLNDALKTLQWRDVASYIRKTYPEAKGSTVGEAIQSLPKEKKEEFCKEVQRRLEAKAK